MFSHLRFIHALHVARIKRRWHGLWSTMSTKPNVWKSVGRVMILIMRDICGRRRTYPRTANWTRNLAIIASQTAWFGPHGTFMFYVKPFSSYIQGEPTNYRLKCLTACLFLQRMTEPITWFFFVQFNIVLFWTRLLNLHWAKWRHLAIQFNNLDFHLQNQARLLHSNA